MHVIPVNDPSRDGGQLLRYQIDHGIHDKIARKICLEYGDKSADGALTIAQNIRRALRLVSSLLVEHKTAEYRIRLDQAAAVLSSVISRSQSLIQNFMLRTELWKEFPFSQNLIQSLWMNILVPATNEESAIAIKNLLVSVLNVYMLR
jgi:hypothetical protein